MDSCCRGNSGPEVALINQPSEEGVAQIAAACVREATKEDLHRLAI
jgi:hypothetical protein